MGGDSESAFKNTPVPSTIIPLGPFHKKFLKIWASRDFHLVEACTGTGVPGKKLNYMDYKSQPWTLPRLYFVLSTAQLTHLPLANWSLELYYVS